MGKIIVAVDENNGIGFNGQLLEKFPEDMQRFYQITVESGYIMMGRKTYNSLPKKPLPYRSNYVITRNPESFNDPNVKFIDLEEAKRLLKLTEYTPIDFCIIGGGMIYKELLPYCNEIYLTKILKTHENVDTFFPELKENEWFKVLEEMGESDNVSYQFWHYYRRS